MWATEVIIIVNNIIRWNINKNVLKTEVEASMEAITNWLTMSGMRVNEEKTECCLFYEQDQEPMSIEINGKFIKSKKHMGVLGLLFDS